MDMYKSSLGQRFFLAVVLGAAFGAAVLDGGFERFGVSFTGVGIGELAILFVIDRVCRVGVGWVSAVFLVTFLGVGAFLVLPVCRLPRTVLGFRGRVSFSLAATEVSFVFDDGSSSGVVRERPCIHSARSEVSVLLDCLGGEIPGPLQKSLAVRMRLSRSQPVVRLIGVSRSHLSGSWPLGVGAYCRGGEVSRGGSG